MSADTVFRVRIDSETKERPTEALKAMGLSVSDAIRMLMRRLGLGDGKPFGVVADELALHSQREGLTFNKVGFAKPGNFIYAFRQ